MSDQKKVVGKKHGIAHVFAATTYSWAGFKRLLSETVFRHELTLTIVVGAVLAYLGASATHLVIFVVFAMVTLAVEALSSAIEEIVDLVSPDWSEAAKKR